MITELLDFTRTRIGSGIPLSPTRSDLTTICRSVVEELETGRPEAAITIDRRGDTAGTWDQDRLAQVFSNIVGNALDHGVDSAATIRLDGTAADTVAIEVRNGGAIPADQLSTLFDPSCRPPESIRGRALAWALHRRSDRARARRQHRSFHLGRHDLFSDRHSARRAFRGARLRRRGRESRGAGLAPPET